MRPSRCINEINGSRPASLRVGKESHSIGKKSAVKNQLPHQQKQPVIIYAHSPKVIHTRAEDFMALVQRLTGRLSRPQEEGHHKPEPEIGRNPNNDVSESSSVVTEEPNCVNGGGGGEDDNTTTFSPEKKANYQLRHLADIPLFTPSSMSLFGSPNPGFRRFEPALYLSPNRTDLVSPSVFKCIKEFPWNM